LTPTVISWATTATTALVRLTWSAACPTIPAGMGRSYPAGCSRAGDDVQRWWTGHGTSAIRPVGYQLDVAGPPERHGYAAGRDQLGAHHQ